MKITKISALLFLVTAFTFLSCSKDDSETDKFQPRNKVYALNAVASSNVTGSATFTENEDGSTSILLSLNNSSTDIHPAHIHLNNVITKGPVAVTLTSIECNCEESITEVSKLDNGTPISYDELIKFNGYINVHQSATAMQTIIVQGNIGSNAN